MSVQLTDEEIQKIAYLAKISKNLSPQEIQKYREELLPIINIAKELEKVDTQNLQATDGCRTFGIKDLREDESSENGNQNSSYQRVRQNIIANWKAHISSKSSTSSTKYGNLLDLPGIFAES